MKTYHLKDLLKKNLLLIELSENGNTFDDLTFLDSETEGYTLLGKPDEISEEDAKEIVEKVMNGQHFQNYNPKEVWDRWCKTALESFNSALESEIFWENPYKDRKENEDLDEHLHNWQESEIYTFDRSRTLIFVKN